MNDNYLLVEIKPKRGWLFNVRISKPLYSFWFVGLDRKDNKKLWQIIGINFIDYDTTKGLQFILWGINIIIAWRTNHDKS